MKRLISTLLLLFLLSSCSLKSVVVPFLDHFIANRINRSLELQSSAKRKLLTDIQVLLEEVKPQIRKLDTRLNQVDIEKGSVKDELIFLNTIYFNVAKKVTPILAKYIASFDSEKTKDFFDNLNERNEELEEKLKEKDLESYMDRFQYFFGDFTPEQKLHIEKALPAYLQISQNRVKSRRVLQNQLKKIMHNPEYQEKEQKITDLFNKYSDRRKLDQDLVVAASEVQNFTTLLNKDQKLKFQERLINFSAWLSAYLKEDYL